MHRRGLATLLAFAAAPAWGQSSQSQGQGEGERVYAIQNRRYLMAHEFSLSGGVLPMDAFFKGATISGAYTYHFTDLMGWEALRGIYSWRIATGLEDDLETNFGVRPTAHEGWDYAVSSSFVFKPLYGKIAAANRTVVHHEVFLVAGPSAAHLPEGFAYGPSLGVGLRFFISRLFSIRFDARDMVHIGGGDTRNDVWLALGLSLSVGGEDKP